MGRNNSKGAQNTTYLHKNDERRSKYRCINYKENGYCKYSFSKCIGSTHCSQYREVSAKKVVLDVKDEQETFDGIELIDIDTIKIPPHFLRKTPSVKKRDEVVAFYRANKCMDKPVYVSVDGDKYLLEDKYLRYRAAVHLGLRAIPARIGDSRKEEYLFEKNKAVKHSKWGNGTIISANTNNIIVNFEKHGEKKFNTSACLKYSYLQPIEFRGKKKYKKNPSVDMYTEVVENVFKRKKESEYRHKEITTIKDTDSEKMYLSVVERKGKSYYEIGKIRKKENEKVYVDLSASATYQLYSLLKKNTGALLQDEEETSVEENNNDIQEWDKKEIDFVPYKEGKRKSINERKKEIIAPSNRLVEIKSRIKNKNTFDEYSGVSTRLMPHQKAACEIAKEFERFAFFYDTGTGKTVLSLEIMANKYKQEQAKFLVICPKPIIKAAWLTDQKEFFPNMKLMPLSKNITLIDYKRMNNRWNAIDQESNFHDKIFYEDWEFNKTKAEQFKYIQSVLLGKAEHYIVNGESFIKDFDAYKKLGITGLIVDESAVLKNFDSKLCQRVREFSKGIKYTYLLSGKPAPNNSSEYFSQMKIVDPETFSMSVKSFRDKYYHNVNGRLKLNMNRKTELFEMIAKKSIIVSKTDCLDLPDTTRVVRKFELPIKIMDKYNAMCYQLITSFKEMDKENEKKQNVNKVFVANNKLSAMMKLREITSGFIKNDQGISSAIDDSKQKELFNLIDEIGNNQIIIWCQFKYEIENLAKALIKSGKSVVTAFSGTIDIDKSITSFKEGKADILIAHPKTLQYGVTLVNCCFAIYYSMSYSFEQYEQSYARIYRNGQKNFCSYYFLQAENTIDEKIYECVMQKKKDVETCEYILKAINEHANRYRNV